jgi:predicted AlkP superfamily pyrophosphatase or phosphodiesterase
MKIRLVSLIVILFTALVARAADDTHALIISIDGLRGQWSSHPAEHGLMLPNLQKLAARGVCAAGVRGIFPTVTYPSHTTLITGCLPARHGILANGVFSPPTSKPSQRWYWEYKFIQVPTILDAAHAAGWTTGAVSWPVTVGGPLDYQFPEIWEPGKFDDAFVEINKHCTPPDLIARILTKYELGMGSAGRDVSLTNASRFIVEQYQPRLMLVHLVELDDAQHSHGPDSPEAREAAEKCDAHVGEIMTSYEKAKLFENTIIAIVSDHGFLAVNKTFNVNALLREKGLIKAGEKKDDPARDFDAVAWISGGSCAIILKNPHDAAVLSRVREALAPYSGKPDSPIGRIFERSEIEKLGANPQADLMLSAGEGFTMGGKLSGPVIAESSGDKGKFRGMHGQFPDRPELEATFLVAGPHIAKATLDKLDMVDVAPTLAAAMGLSLPKAEGKVVQQVLDKK